MESRVNDAKLLWLCDQCRSLDSDIADHIIRTASCPGHGHGETEKPSATATRVLSVYVIDPEPLEYCHPTIMCVARLHFSSPLCGEYQSPRGLTKAAHRGPQQAPRVIRRERAAGLVSGVCRVEAPPVLVVPAVD